MFTAIKTARIISLKIGLANKLTSYYCFSAKRDLFVKSARTLERLKSSESFSDVLYEEGRYILFLKGDLVLTDDSEKLSYKNFEEVANFKKNGEAKTILLDILTESNAEICLFAVDLDISSDANIKKLEGELDASFIKIRHSLYFLNLRDSQYVTHAKGLFHFCKTYLYCCYCGGNLTIKEGGYQKHCVSCKATHYPHLTPVGLTLVEDEAHQQVLLVRQQRHPPGMYTCVAGFIEPGESLEQNIKREVAEEVGLEVQSIEYCLSQHWALPSSQLTLGCIATSKRKDADIDCREVLDAKWVNADELKKAVLRIREIRNLNEINETKLWAPPRNAVSHNLMVAWLKKYHNFDID